MSNQFSIELGLTEQQKQQIVPILKEELTQLGALKKDTSLSAVKKVERLRQIGVSFDEKLKPLLNAEQQQKFQAMREDFRRRMIEEMAEQGAGEGGSGSVNVVRRRAQVALERLGRRDIGCGMRNSGGGIGDIG